MLGSYHAEEVSSTSPGKWWAVYVQNGRSFLAQASIEVDAIRDPELDTMEQTTGKEVVIRSSGGTIRGIDDAAPLFLLRGDGISSGPIVVPSIALSDQPKLHPGKQIDFGTAWDSRIFIYATGVVSPRPASAATTLNEDTKLTSIKNYCLNLQLIANKTGKRTGSTLACVADLDGVETGSIEWVGDLNRDGFPDLLIRLNEQNKITSWNFYQSDAKSQVFLKRIATFKASQ